MLDKLSRLIVKGRYVLFALFLATAVFSAVMLNKTVINYDFTDYLGEETVTRKSLDIMEKEFGNTDQLTLMFEDLTDGVCASIAKELHEREGVMRATYDPEKDMRLMDGVKYERVEVFLECEDSVAYVMQLRDELSAREDIGAFHLSGTAAQTIRIKENIAREIAVALSITIFVVLAVLLLSSHSYLDPLVFLPVLGISILINMGTNFIFDSVSFITFAVAAILQLALAMDYSIMLLHNYYDFLKEGGDRITAMQKALARSFMPVTSSSLTTVAGMAALMFMSFTIGFDIGIVLSKGILISMLTAFLFMPSVTLMLTKPLQKTMHRPLPLGGKLIGRFALKTRRVLPFFLIVAILLAAVIQKDNQYTFTDETGEMTSNRLGEVFGLSNQLVLLFPTGMTDEDLDLQRKLIERLEGVTYRGKPAVSSVTSMVTTGEAAVKYYTLSELSELTGIAPAALGIYTGGMGFGPVVRADQLIDTAAGIMTQNQMILELKDTLDFARSMFIGDEYARMILLMDMPYFGEEMYDSLLEIERILKETYPGENVGLAGASMSSYDISSSFGSDMTLVNLLTIAAVFLIILISFKNFAVPMLLVCVIQGAVWITMATSTVAGNRIFFMCYLIISAIMMGATIDYAILLTGNYRRMRETLAAKEAVLAALEHSMPTIFTSAVILIVAGTVIGYVCSIYYIYSIGRMLAKGAAISLVLVLTLLPQMLVNLDRMIAPKNAIK